jgi:hypothetical protein
VEITIDLTDREMKDLKACMKAELYDYGIEEAEQATDELIEVLKMKGIVIQ